MKKLAFLSFVILVFVLLLSSCGGVPNNPPVITDIQITPANPTSNDDITVTVLAGDPDEGDTLTYELAIYAAGAAPGTDGSTPTWTSTNTTGEFNVGKLQAGDYTVEAKVTDSKGKSDSKSKALTVSEPPNQKPTCSITVNPPSVEVGESVSITVTGSDPDGFVVKTEVAVKDTTSYASCAATTCDLSYSPPAAGNYTAVGTVTDDKGEKGTCEVNFSAYVGSYVDITMNNKFGDNQVVNANVNGSDDIEKIVWHVEKLSGKKSAVLPASGVMLHPMPLELTFDHTGWGTGIFKLKVEAFGDGTWNKVAEDEATFEIFANDKPEVTTNIFDTSHEGCCGYECCEEATFTYEATDAQGVEKVCFYFWYGKQPDVGDEWFWDVSTAHSSVCATAATGVVKFVPKLKDLTDNIFGPDNYDRSGYMLWIATDTYDATNQGHVQFSVKDTKVPEITLEVDGKSTHTSNVLPVIDFGKWCFQEPVSGTIKIKDCGIHGKHYVFEGFGYNIESCECDEEEECECQECRKFAVGGRDYEGELDIDMYALDFNHRESDLIGHIIVDINNPSAFLDLGFDYLCYNYIPKASVTYYACDGSACPGSGGQDNFEEAWISVPGTESMDLPEIFAPGDILPATYIIGKFDCERVPVTLHVEDCSGRVDEKVEYVWINNMIGYMDLEIASVSGVVPLTSTFVGIVRDRAKISDAIVKVSAATDVAGNSVVGSIGLVYTYKPAIPDINNPLPEVTIPGTVTGIAGTEVMVRLTLRATDAGCGCSYADEISRVFKIDDCGPIVTRFELSVRNKWVKVWFHEPVQEWPTVDFLEVADDDGSTGTVDVSNPTWCDGSEADRNCVKWTTDVGGDDATITNATITVTAYDVVNNKGQNERQADSIINAIPGR